MIGLVVQDMLKLIAAGTDAPMFNNTGNERVTQY
jgi:hypothetical protein